MAELLKNKWHDAAIGFLYPAILGSTIYGIIDFTFSGSVKFNVNFFTSMALAILIMLIYYWDMVLTSKPEIAEKYSGKLLFIEIFIILTMFPAVQSALGNGNFPILIMVPCALYMAVKKFLCAIWELFHHRKDQTALLIDVVFMTTYLIVGVISLGLPAVGLLITFIVAFVDWLVYLICGEALFVKKK